MSILGINYANIEGVPPTQRRVLRRGLQQHFLRCRQRMLWWLPLHRRPPVLAGMPAITDSASKGRTVGQRMVKLKNIAASPDGKYGQQIEHTGASAYSQDYAYQETGPHQFIGFADNGLVILNNASHPAFLHERLKTNHPLQADIASLSGKFIIADPLRSLTLYTIELPSSRD